jgi:DNA-binding transcriptional ArsR family regulator
VSATSSPQQSREGGEILDNRLAKALAHPLRIEILSEAAKGPLSPKEFNDLKLSHVAAADATPWSVSGISYHFRRLQELDCLEVVRETPRRGAVEHHYITTTRAFYGDIDWDSLPAVVNDSMNLVILRTLNEQVIEAIEAKTFDSRPNNHFTWTAVKLDGQGWDSIMDRLALVYEHLRDEEVAAEARMRESGEQATSATVALAGFESPPSHRETGASSEPPRR